jgi:hypothetical protein
VLALDVINNVYIHASIPFTAGDLLCTYVTAGDQRKRAIHAQWVFLIFRHEVVDCLMTAGG